MRKDSGVIVHLVEELGDARLRCEQLTTYIAEALRLIEMSPHKEAFFEVAGHLIQATPVTLQKLQKSLQAVALAANKIDAEELKNELSPEKVEQLEKALKDVRIKQICRRSEPVMVTPRQVADNLRMSSDFWKASSKSKYTGELVNDSVRLILMQRTVNLVEKQLKELKHSLALYERDSVRYAPQLDNFKDAVRALFSMSNMFLKSKAASEELYSRFEEGVPADPTENMSEEDAEKWEAMTDKYRDKFK